MTSYSLFEKELKRIEDANAYKFEIPIQGPQGGTVSVGKRKVVMLASNNYLGMSNHPAIRRAAIRGIREFGYGLASVRFICGTQTLHLKLEKKISAFLKTEDTILFSSAFAANEAFFASIVNERLGSDEYKDALYSDRLNHASIIDGQRLCRPELVEKKIYEHGNPAHLEQLLKEDEGNPYRFRIIATDGVFSMEGDIAPLPDLVRLAEQYNAILFMDDCHGIGAIGKSGKGTAEYYNLLGKVTVTSGTLGKAIGGAAGGFLSGPKVMIDYFKQKARPYTFSNSLPPAVVSASIAAFDLLKKDKSLVKSLRRNTWYFRKNIQKLGFKILPGEHPIVPVMLGEASLAQEMSKELLKLGVYVKGLWYPVVPKGEARLRCQISAAHTIDNLDKALTAFEKAGKKFGIT